MARRSPTGFGKLDRSDLRGFDDRAQKVILDAMDRGGVGRISTKGHCIIRSPKGSTMSVSRNTASGNRGFQNMVANYRQLFGDLEPMTQTNGSLALVPDIEEHPLVPTTRELVKCPLDTCDAEFATEGARYSHVQKEHFPCAEPGCPKVFDKKNKASGHFNVVHRGAEVRGRTPAECKVPGCGWKGTAAGLPGHKKVHNKAPAQPARKPVKKAAAKKAAVKKAAPVKKEVSPVVAAAEAEDAAVTLAAIRSMLGVDPRVKELEAELAAMRKHAEDLEAKLALLKEALNA
jgi:hypothetical protein